MPLSLKLDHEVFEGGTSITGSLVLEGAPLSAKEVKLVFRGEERTRVVEKASKKAAEAACQLHRSEHIVPGIARSGRITKKETPFEIPIPDDLPQTVTIPWTHLSYFVAFEVEDRKGRIVDKGEEKVIILAKQIIHQPSPFVREPFSEYVKKNRFKKGNLIITARIDDVVLEPGQVVGVQVAIRNRSPLKVEKVKALLKQEVHATAVENEREAERILTFHEFKEYRKTKRKRKKWLRGTDLQEDMDALQDEVEEEEHAGELRVPKNSTLTYNGQLFDVKHYLHVEIKTSKNDVKIAVVPIEIARKEPIEEAEEVASEDSEAYDKFEQKEESRVSFFVQS